VGTNHISGTADRLRCCQLRWTVSVVNWWRSSVTSLSHWPSTSVYNTVGVRHLVAVSGSGDLSWFAIRRVNFAVNTLARWQGVQKYRVFSHLWLFKCVIRLRTCL